MPKRASLWERPSLRRLSTVDGHSVGSGFSFLQEWDHKCLCASRHRHAAPVACRLTGQVQVGQSPPCTLPCDPPEFYHADQLPLSLPGLSRQGMVWGSQRGVQTELLKETGRPCGPGVVCVCCPCLTALQFFFGFYFKLIHIYHNTN